MANPIDDKTKKEITDRAYVVLKPHIVIKQLGIGDPDLVMSAENKEYYDQEITLTDDSFIQMLIDLGKINLRHP